MYASFAEGSSDMLTFEVPSRIEVASTFVMGRPADLCASKLLARPCLAGLARHKQGKLAVSASKASLILAAL